MASTAIVLLGRRNRRVDAQLFAERLVPVWHGKIAGDHIEITLHGEMTAKQLHSEIIARSQ